jgi:hypothetical protein
MTTKHIGFTGGREHPTEHQLVTIRLALLAFKETAPNAHLTFHHGDCVGSDEAAAIIAQKLGYYTVAHPPTNPKLRAYHSSDDILPEKGYFDRNRDIVNSSDVLLATPFKDEAQGGGTWYTIHYAQQTGVPSIILKREP